MQFPEDMKGLMKDCILSIFWPKNDIISFLKNHGCTAQELALVKEKDSLARVKIIETIFDRLSSRNDSGIVQFSAMLEALSSWSHFNEYWFEKEKKLNREIAQKNILNLRKLKEGREEKLQKKAAAKDQKYEEVQKSNKTLEELRQEFYDLLSNKVTPQQKGYKLEKILIGLAKLAELEITNPFKITGEQIDGSIKFDGEHYLLEAKWEDRALSNEPLYVFSQKIEGKMHGRGIFVSINGFTKEALQTLNKGRVINTILMDGEDLVGVFDKVFTIKQLLDRKIKAAQTKGIIYLHGLTEKDKAS